MEQAVEAARPGLELRERPIEDGETSEEHEDAEAEHSATRKLPVEPADRVAVERIDPVEHARRRRELEPVEPAVMERDKAQQNGRPLRREGREQRDDADGEAVGVAAPGEVEHEPDGQHDERGPKPRPADDAERLGRREDAACEQRHTDRRDGRTAHGGVCEEPPETDRVRRPRNTETVENGNERPGAGFQDLEAENEKQDTGGGRGCPGRRDGNPCRTAPARPAWRRLELHGRPLQRLAPGRAVHAAPAGTGA